MLSNCLGRVAVFLRVPTLAFLLLSTVASPSAFSQTLNHQGNDFILAFLPISLNPPAQAHQVQLHLTSESRTSVTVAYPVNAPTFTMTVDIIPGSVTTVDLDVVASSAWSAGNVANNAVRVFGPDAFGVYMTNRRGGSSDAALALPIATLNTEYIVTTFKSDIAASDRGLFAVVAAFDHTTVTITPSKPLTGGFAQGIPFTRILNRGEGFLGQSTFSGDAGDLTGTIVQADKPVGMTNGNICTNVPSNIPTCDHVFEVAQPVQSWGASVLVVNLPNRPDGSVYRIVASQDDTTVSQDGMPLGTINRGQFITTAPLPDHHVFDADHPIFVAQFMTGSGSSGSSLGDPAMGNMISSAQYLSAYTFSTVDADPFAENYVTIIADNTDVGRLALDGAPVPVAHFTPIGNSGFSAAVVSVSEGVHTTASPHPHGITVEGFGTSDSYLYPGGARAQFIHTHDAFAPAVAVTPMGDHFQGLATDSEDANANGVLEAGEDRNANGTLDLRSEDVNHNGILEPGEDTNGDSRLNADMGMFSVTLDADAVNLALTVSPFDPGASAAAFTVDIIDPSQPLAGVLRVMDGGGNEVTTSLSGDGNQPPILQPIGTKGTRPDARLEFTVSAGSPDGDAVSFSIGTGGLPHGATFDPPTGVFSWTASSSQAGNLFTINFVATDNGFPSATSSAAVSIGVGKFVSVTNTDPNQADTDGDGDDDGTEVTQGTDPLDASSPSNSRADR